MMTSGPTFQLFRGDEAEGDHEGDFLSNTNKDHSPLNQDVQCYLDTHNQKRVSSYTRLCPL